MNFGFSSFRLGGANCSGRLGGCDGGGCCDGYDCIRGGCCDGCDCVGPVWLDISGRKMCK